MKHFNILWKLLSLAVVIIAASPGAIAQPLSGIYTIGGTSPDYATINAAVSDLTANGVSGPVTFNIRSGTYNEKVIITAISGASASNRITFKSETNNAADVTMSSSSTYYSDNGLFHLNSANYVSIKHLTLESTGTSYAAGVQLGGSASFDSVLNCAIVLPTSTSTIVGGIMAYFNGSVYPSGSNNNVIKNNTITGGGTGFTLYCGSSSPGLNNWIIENNTVTNFGYMGVYMYGSGGMKFRNNTFTTNTTYSVYGVYSYYGLNGMEFTGNTVTLANNFSYGTYWVNGSGMANNSSTWTKVENNTFNLTASGTSSRAFYVSSCDFGQWKNNTLNLTTGSGTHYTMFFASCSNMLFDSNAINATSSSGSLSSQVYGDNMKFRKNTINCSASTSGTVYGIQQNGGYTGGDFSGNKINISSATGSVYGLYQAIPGQTITNNVINTNTNSGSNYTFYATNPQNTSILNNTFHSRSGGSTNYVARFSSSGGNTKIYNNVFSKTGTSGYSLYLSSNANIICDYNNIYTASGTSLAYSGGNYSTLQAWRTATGKDMNSISYDPGYTSTTNLTPDPANAASWSLNGRGVQIAGNNVDINNNVRSTTLAAGVPDIGAYEFTPTATPPAATASPAVPTAGATQVFTFGQDTVATLVWPVGGTVPASIVARQYSGTLPPAINSLSLNQMYFYTDISVPAGTYNHTSNIYYKDPWMGTTASEQALRLAKKDGSNPWTAYTMPASSVNTTQNILNTTGLNTFGLFTGIDAGNNAGAVAIVDPVSPFCVGTYLVKAKIANTGNNVLNSVQVNWSINGVAQTPVSYTTVINTLGSGLGNEAVVNLGNVAFNSTPKTIKVWTSSPNSQADLYNSDDTLSATLRTSLSGIYTVGGTTPDYPSIAAAVTDLNTYGVCGPVTFNLRNGTYTERTVLKPVIGAGAVNTITFKSETNNAANVTVTYNSSSSANYIFQLDSAEYFVFKDLTVQSQHATYGRVFDFKGTASYNKVEECVIDMPSTTSTGNTNVGIYMYYPFYGTDNTITGNTIQDGSYAVLVNGSAANRILGQTIENNTITNAYYRTISCYYADDMKILGNSITNASSSASQHYSIYLDQAMGATQVRNNIVNLTGSGYLYPLRASYCTGDPSDPSARLKVVGNTFNATGTTTNYVYGCEMQYNSYDSVANNTFNLVGKYYIWMYYDMYGNGNVSDNNTINITNNSTSSYYSYLYLHYNGGNNIMSNNDINIEATGPAPAYLYTTSYGTNNIFTGNNLSIQGTSGAVYNYGINYSNNNEYTNNNIDITTTSGAIYGLYSWGSHGSYSGGLISGNKFNINSTSGTVYGIYQYYPNSINLVNNVVSAKTSGTSRVVYSQYPINTNYYNNTFYAKGTGSTNNAAYIFTNASTYNGVAQSVKLRNNIFAQDNGGGYALSLTDVNYVNSDYNNIYTSSGSNLAQASSGNATTIQQWRTLTGQDMNSLTYNPGFTSATDLTPDAANAASWSLNGRGEHAGFNNKDINGNTRVTSKAAGVPDIGPYEFTPSVIPPLATPNIAASAGAQQVFTFGQDTVARIDWDASATIPSTIEVRQYTGTVPPSFITGNYPYFYTDISTPSGSYAHATKLYYKEPWTGTLIGESGFRLVKKDGSNAWQIFGSPASTTNPIPNINTTTGLVDFGYHTLSDVANNAATAELVSPNAYFCAPNTLPIKVKILNNGNNVLNSVKVGWTANGVAQTTLNYNTPIGIAGTAQGNEAIVTLGNYTFPNSNPVNFVFYTFSPNGQNDPAKADDTLKITVKPGLNGVYTIGGTSPDYATIPDAIADVNQFGICGNVVFNIRPGTYTDGGVIKGPIQGASTTSRVTFQSESGVSSSVNITTAKPSVFDLSETSYVTVKNVKMTNTSTSAGAIVILKGVASNDSIVGCIMQGPSVTSSSPALAVVSATGFSGNAAVIQSNTISGGSAAIYMTGGSNVVFDSNTVTGGQYYPAYINNSNGLKFRGNQITHTYASTLQPMYFYQIGPAGNNAPEFSGNTFNTVAYYSPVYMYSFNGTASNRAKISNNTIVANTTNYFYNYFVYYCSYADVFNNDLSFNTSANSYVYFYMGQSSSYCSFNNNKINLKAAGFVNGWEPSYSNYCKFYNNVVNATGGTGGTSCAFRATSISYDTIYNNTFNLNSGSSSSYAAYFTFSGGNLVVNNVFSNKAGGPVMYNTAAGSSNTMDYNNLYTTSTSAFVTGSTASTLQAWRTASGYDRNSLSYDPGFISNTDLHPDPANPASWSLNGRGIHIANNNVDFDGNPRVTTLAAGVPDIGAYEFTPTSIPPLATAIPATPTAGVPQTFLFGQDTVARITWAPNSVVPNTIEVRQYTGTVAPTFPAPGYLYFYTDINTANISYNFTTDIYYKDPWRGTTGTEGNLRMIRKNVIWDAFNGSMSSTDVNRNIFRAPSLNSTGWFTGVDDNTMFSAIITAAANPVICAGGGVVLNANTGIGYTYQWLFNGSPIPGANGPSYTATQHGDYQVQITNSGNVTATSVPLSIVVVAAPSANVAASGPLTYCPGGVLNLNANTGPGLNYQWQFNGTNIPSATNATYSVNVAGNYTVTVSNIGCATTSAVIPVNAGPLNVQLGSDTAFCQSKTTPLVLNAGYPGAKFTWSTGDTSQAINVFSRSGTYWVHVDAGVNCVDDDTIEVNISPLPSVVGINYGHTGSTFQFSPAGAQNVKRYLWIFGNTYQDTAQVATFTYNGYTAMEVKLVVFNDCGSDTSYLQLPLNINSSSSKEVIFNLYPNPAVSDITLSTEGGLSFGEITILNGLGQVVYRGDANNNSTHTINVNSLANGRYLIRANTSDGMVISKPFNVVR